MLTTEATAKSKTAPRRLCLRTLVKLALAVFIYATVALLPMLVPAIVNADDLWALLNYADDCKAPCFMDIMPGKTTVAEVMTILENHPWVLPGSISEPYNDTIRWNWSSQQPAIFRSELTGEVWTPSNQAYAIRIPTSLTWSTLWLNLGMPTSGFVAFTPEDMLHRVGYDWLLDSHLTGWTHCPASFKDFWNSPVNFNFGEGVGSSSIRYNPDAPSYSEQVFTNMGCP
jgi:hypothetical protein